MSIVENPLETLTRQQLRKRTSEKWQHYPQDVLPLWVAEMDVEPAPTVVEALTHALRTGDTGYPSGDPYPQAFQQFAAHQWGWDGFSADRMRTVPDVMTGISAAINVLTEPGDAVIVCSPVYPPFYLFTRELGRTVLEAPLTDNGRLDPAAISAAFEQARATTRQPVLLLANPHNPTGVAHTRYELTTVVEIARLFNGRIIADEIHAPLMLDSTPFTPLLSVDGAQNAFSVFSASKAWNLAGLKAAVLCAGPHAQANLARVPSTVDRGVSHLGVLSNTAALTGGQDWLTALLKGLTGNRNLVMELVREHLPGVEIQAPEATYLAWLDCTDLDLPEQGPDTPAAQHGLTGPAAFFFNHANVALNDGALFGSGGQGHVRLNFGTSPAIVREAIEHMGAAVREFAD